MTTPKNNVESWEENFRGKWEGANTHNNSICTPVMDEMIEDIRNLLLTQSKAQEVEMFEDIEKHERTKKAIKNKEVVYLSENGYVICEDDYLAWEEWVQSVAIPNSSVEKFTEIDLQALTHPTIKGNNT